MIRVVAAPPYLTVQDLGRVGWRAIGVPPSGAMDPATVMVLNRLVGNEDGAAVLEWAIAGGTLRAEAPLIVAFGGAEVQGMLDGAPLVPYTAHRIAAGAELRVTRVVRGRFCYVAVAGGIDVPVVLGSRSTLMAAGFGGFEGRRLRRDDRVLTGGTSHVMAHAKTLPLTIAPALDPAPIDIVRGPHLDRVPPGTWEALLSTAWHVAMASDRSGYRLEGGPLPAGPAERPSEPTCVGAVQLPPDGRPIIIMPDGPTVGGYPIVAVVSPEALGRLAQRMPGDAVVFTPR